MSAAQVEKVSILVGQALVTIPAELAAKAYLEKLLEQSRPVPLLPPMTLPVIGTPWHDGKFAGLTVFENRPFGLVLLPGELQREDWDKSGDWAKSLAGILPSRFDQLVLLQNMKGEFKTDVYYWSSEQRAGHPDSAYVQYFGDGIHYWTHRSRKCAARAVRRIPLQ